MFRRILPLVILAAVAGCAGTTSQPTQKEQMHTRWNAARGAVLHNLATQQFQSGNFAASRQSIDQALGFQPESAAFRTLSAQLYIEEGRLELAQGELSIARASEPELAEPHYLQGVIFQRWQRLDDALASYTTAATLEPNELAYLMARAETLVALGRLGEALPMLQERMSFFENSPTIRDAAAQMLMQQRRHSEAVRLFRQASILAPDDHAIRERLALAHLKAGQPGDAAVALERLLRAESHADRSDLLVALGQSHLAMNRPRDAREAFDRALRIDATSVPAHLGVARIALELNDTRRAEMSIRRSIALEPANAEGHLLMGYLRLRGDQLEPALASFQQAAALDRSDPLPVCMVGLVLEKMGRTEEALEHYARALRIRPGDELAGTLLAQIQLHD